ncbi:hypothetical protein ES703_69154 [subsurface metagenome]
MNFAIYNKNIIIYLGLGKLNFWLYFTGFTILTALEYLIKNVRSHFELLQKLYANNINWIHFYKSTDYSK